MPGSESEKSKNDGSGTDGEEEEYVVERVVDKKIKNGKVRTKILQINK